MTSARISAISAEITNDPEGLGYAGMPDAEVARVMNAIDPVSPRTVFQSVHIGLIHQTIDNMVDANGIPVWEYVEAAQGAQDATGIAARAALRLRNARADYPDVRVDSPIFQAQLGVLVSAGLLTQAQSDVITALGAIPVSRAGELGLGPVHHLEIAEARRG